MKSAMTSSPLRVAIIGAGQVADKVHASYYCTRNDLELVAVCDSRLSQAQALADKYGNASVWDDPQAMLLAVKPDVVSVCSPNRFHYEHTLMALEAGCHVMCEKPPAMTPEQAREMCDTARKLGKVLAYDFHHRFALDTQQLRELQQCYTAKERRLQQHTSAQLHAGETVTLQKLVWIDWRDDRQAVLDEWGSASLRQLEMCAQQSYDQLLAVSTENWRQWWQKRRITVNGGEAHDQQALDYALYHLRIMTPAHDERSSIAAKGLTGEGYKGHVFWDTEVFLLPFHLFSDPTVARSLLRYRWHNLPGAQEKARRNGWQGALFPWESARSGEEETPEFAAINIRTGLRQKVASAQAEHHLVADIAWAVIQYWQTTGDESFIAHEGMALLLETAKFWISRAVRVNDRLEIHDVIGPDEYTEHVNNNAFTSYMAYYNVQQALSIARQFGCSDDAFIHRAEMFLKELRLPEIQPDGVLPQDDSFMAKPAINLAKYKAAAGKQTILLDYSRAEVNEMQILKQADVVMLNYMLPEQFSAASCLANLQFYEPRTIHDSSLSKAIHGIVAARCGLLTQSYQFWREGTEIDLGADPHSCDDGIHAAATGAIWLGAIQGFAGVSVRDGELHLNPALPEQWQQLSFPLFWQGCELQVTLDAQRIAIRTSAPVSLRLNGQLISVAEESVFCLGDFILPFNGTATTHQEDE